MKEDMMFLWREWKISSIYLCSQLMYLPLHSLLSQKKPVPSDSFSYQISK